MCDVHLAHLCGLRFEPRHSTLSFFSSAFLVFDEMPLRELLPPKSIKNSWFSTPKLLDLAAGSHISFVRVIVDCIVENNITIRNQLHCLVTKCGFSSNRFISSCLITSYSRHGFVQEARSVFNRTSSKDLVLWNAMISCYSSNGLGKEAFRVFQLMRVAGYVGDGFTFSSLLASCCSLGCSSSGKQTHSLVIKLGFNPDVVVATALIDMYMKCGRIEDARGVFNLANNRNILFWNAAIVGHGQFGDSKEAMKLFRQMIRERYKPDEVTLASVLSSSAHSAMANEAIQVHSVAVKTGFQNYLSAGNALIMAYAKIGCISSASRCFSHLSKPDIISWTSMINAYAYHGLAREAIGVFETMIVEGTTKPDKVAFLGVLSACSHAGLVETGSHYLASMKNEYRIEPGLEHYTCLVDLLGRSGHLSEAYNVIASVPFEPGGDVLGAFLGACKQHKDAEMAKLAAERLFSVEAEEPVTYKLVSNLYAGLGLWDDVKKVRKMMRDQCGENNKSVPGCSWIESRGAVCTFVSGDESHPQASEMYCVLRMLVRMMKDDEDLQKLMQSF